MLAAAIRHEIMLDTMAWKSYFFVANVFESVGDDGDAHVDQVRGGHLEDLLGELLAILVDFLKMKMKSENELKYGIIGAANEWLITYRVKLHFSQNIFSPPLLLPSKFQSDISKHHFVWQATESIMLAELRLPIVV